jgi:hypothetical protein
MRTGRPRTPIGTHGAINTRREGGRVVAETRVRDLDGRLRQVRATGPTAASARPAHGTRPRASGAPERRSPRPTTLPCPRSATHAVRKPGSGFFA